MAPTEGRVAMPERRWGCRHDFIEWMKLQENDPHADADVDRGQFSPNCCCMLQATNSAH